MRVALVLLLATVAYGGPAKFVCTRSMAVGEAKPMDANNTIELMADRSIVSVGGIACGGTVTTGTPHAVAFTLPSEGNFKWLIESKGVTSVFSNPVDNCDDRTNSDMGTGTRTVTFSSEGTATLRMLASTGADASTGAAAECNFTVTAPAAGGDDGDEDEDEAELTTLEATATLVGMNEAKFTQPAQDAFKTAVASAIEKEAADVVITDFVSRPRRCVMLAVSSIGCVMLLVSLWLCLSGCVILAV